MSESQPDEKKIIVDEDWKAQVERERDEAATPPAPEEEKPVEKSAAGPFPPATLTTLATTLMTQAMASLGQFPSSTTGNREVDLALAKHMIDTLDVVFQKTEGNRTDAETKLYDSLLHQLRMAFVAAQSVPPNATNSSGDGA